MRLFPFLGLYKLPHILALLRGISCLGYVSFFYLGYLIGNGYWRCSLSIKRLSALTLLAFILQIAEGSFYYQFSVRECGTAMKLSAALTSSLCCLLIHRFITSQASVDSRFFKLLGDHSFGIFFAHLFIMRLLKHIPHYETYLPFPILGALILVTTLAAVMIGKRILGRYGKYFAF